MDEKQKFSVIKDNVQHYPFGPYLAQFDLDPKFCRRLIKVGKASKIKFNQALAGRIKKEFKIDLDKYSWIRNYLNEYVMLWLKNYSIFGVELVREPLTFDIEQMWINIMKKGEYNPYHIHKDCHLSYVIYLKTPHDALKQTKKDPKGTHGRTNFYHGETRWSNVSHRIIYPKENTMVMFPASLGHSVDQYELEGERITCAGNIKFSDFQKNFDVY